MRISRSQLPLILVLLISIIGYTVSFSQIDQYRRNNRLESRIAYIPPVEMLKIISLDYKGMVSKLLLFRGMVYYGERQEQSVRQDLPWIYNSLEASTTLDPYNIDSYYFAQAALPWDGMAAETNIILERGMKYRDWDFYIPFFIGFNHFQFLGDDAKAAEYFDRAAKINPALIELSLKFHYRANQIPVAIAILEELHKNIGNEDIRKNIEIRIEAYTGAYTLHKGVQAYKKRYNNHPPNNLNQLVAKGLIAEIPKDPYGGEFYYDAKEDRIKTTSNFLFKQTTPAPP